MQKPLLATRPEAPNESRRPRQDGDFVTVQADLRCSRWEEGLSKRRSGCRSPVEGFNVFSGLVGFIPKKKGSKSRAKAREIKKAVQPKTFSFH